MWSINKINIQFRFDVLPRVCEFQATIQQVKLSFDVECVQPKEENEAVLGGLKE